MPHDPIPKKFEPRWKSPPGGLRERDPTLAVWFEAEFGKSAEPHKFAPWEVLFAVKSLLGDHPCELYFGRVEDPGPLHRAALPVRPMGSGGGRLRAPLSWFARSRNWVPLEPIWQTYWWMDAHRGGGAHRHAVWRLHCEDFRPHPSRVRFVIRTFHLPQSGVQRLHKIMLRFFDRCAGAGCHYGRGDIITAPDPASLEPPEDRTREVWAHCTQPDQLVPGVHRFNFLGPGHLRRIGGLSRLKSLGDRDVHSTLTVEPAGDGVVVTTSPVHRDLTYGFGFEHTDLRDPFEAVWLLSEFSRAGMLAVQNMDWMESELRRIEEFNEQQERAARRPPPPRRPVASWIAPLRARAPAFIRAAAAPARTLSPVKRRGSGAHGSRALTEFEIAAPGGKRALPVFGVAAGPPPLLACPIRAGSLDPGRAAFTFDALRHGWDGETSPPEFPPEPRRLKQAKCPRCEGRAFELRAAFEYPDDLMDEEGLTEDIRQRPEDFFSWFWLHARCPACAWEGLLADIECA